MHKRSFLHRHCWCLNNGWYLPWGGARALCIETYDGLGGCDIAGYYGSSSDLGVVPDGDWTDNLCPGTDEYPVPHNSVATTGRAVADETGALIDSDIVTDDRGFSYDDLAAVVDEHPVADDRPGVNGDSAGLCRDGGDGLRGGFAPSGVPQAMGHPVGGYCV